MHYLSRIVIPPLLLLALTSCALMENQFEGSPPDLPPGEGLSPTRADDAGAGEKGSREGISRSAAELAERQAAESDRVEPVLYRGTNRQFKPPEAREPVKLRGDSVTLNFEEAPLGEVLHAVMGDILGLDYIVDHPVQGKVTLRTRTPIPRDQLLEVLESLLKANDVLMVRDKQGRYIVTGSQQAMRMSPEVSSAGASGTGFSTIIVPLQFISASGMAEILKPVADESAFVRVDNVRNLLMLAGTQAQLRGWLDMINTFDVDMLKGMSVGLFPLEHSGVEETATVLNGMLNSGGGGGGSSKEGEGGGGGKGNFAQLVKIIPIKRLNSLLVVTPRSHYLDTVETWISRLDATPDARFAKRLYVYPVQNTTATRLADLLKSIYTGGSGKSDGGGRSSGGEVGQGGVAPGLSMESIGGGQEGGGYSGLDDSGGGGEGFASAVADTASSGSLEIDDVRVVADDENNALMIYATGKQYEVIQDALQQLDVVATQVHIEASILEVTLTDELQYGLEWEFSGGLGGGGSGGTGLLDFDGDPGFPAQAGFSYAIANSGGTIKAMLNALASDSLVNVISTPSVMVLDNHEAFIHVGDQVPIEQGSLVGGGSDVVSRNYQYRDTGVKLSVKPSVNAGRLVTMDVEQSVTDVGADSGVGDQPTFLERNIKSRVAVRSGESVVLGGLIRENASSTDKGVPFLHRIPVLGVLFGSTNNSNRRTELIVIITPRVVANESELRDVSKELRSRVRKLELIRGGVDQTGGSE